MVNQESISTDNDISRNTHSIIKMEKKEKRTNPRNKNIQRKISIIQKKWRFRPRLKDCNRKLL